MKKIFTQILIGSTLLVGSQAMAQIVISKLPAPVGPPVGPYYIHIYESNRLTSSHGVQHCKADKDVEAVYHNKWTDDQQIIVDSEGKMFCADIYYAANANGGPSSLDEKISVIIKASAGPFTAPCNVHFSYIGEKYMVDGTRNLTEECTSPSQMLLFKNAQTLGSKPVKVELLNAGTSTDCETNRGKSLDTFSFLPGKYQNFPVNLVEIDGGGWKKVCLVVTEGEAGEKVRSGPFIAANSVSGEDVGLGCTLSIGSDNMARAVSGVCH